MNTLEIAKCYATKAEQAKSRGKEFALSFTYFANLKAQTHCAYSGIELKANGPNGFSFERLNNDVGYVDGNVIVVAQELNQVRSNLATSADVLERIEFHKDAIRSRVKACNSAKAKIGSLKKRISDADETPTYELRDKLVIPAALHAHWRKIHTHNQGVQRDLNHVKQLIEENMIHIIKWETKASKHSKTKIKNLEIMNSHHKERVEFLTKALCKYNGCIAKFEKRACKVQVVSPKVQDWTNDLNTTTKLLEATLKNIDLINESICKLEIVAEGLKKFENLGKTDKYRVQLGLPLNTPLSILLKNKITYNLINKI